MSVAGTTELVSLKGVSVSFGKKNVLENVDLCVEKRRIVTLIGPNGSGKTTLVKVLLGLQEVSSGRVQRATDMRIGYMPQKLHIDSTMPLTVGRFLGLSGANAQQCREALQRVAVAHLVESPVYGLSGGEMQRVLLARALSNKPDLLVLDEPVQGVDLAGQELLYQLIGQLRDELGCGVLMVSHDLHLVMAATDEVVCLNKHVCCHGSPQSVTANPAYLQLFGDKTAFYNHVHDHSHDLHGEVCAHEQPQKGSGDA
ncbi:zinc ABC transporter ATP-binding protein ZnuC [Porticoccus sp. W117]|uniref:zinc ABC transporter ATP-binding protein ZnuC n=1 Tax=Porticoccus sp. W117 TaxID=3054777 RepID=UPI0025945AE9|nr:zinc ABC transporter ATP-binding protein ZnuC [Porticoccus sp. W117]MDM3870807.1 zinc ABC transporter ATP-binding protein ZnuC [Porticoccus sp. W117]